MKTLKDSDFLPGFFDSWSILIKENEYSLEKSYLNNTCFTSEREAEREKDRIIAHRIKQRLPPYFSIIIKLHRVRRLKTPISVG
jgi:hypothetical protein